MYIVECENCREVNQLNDLAKDKKIKCHICSEVIQEKIIQKEDRQKETMKDGEFIINVGKDFYIKKIINYILRTNDINNFISINGEIKNSSNKNYESVMFDVSAYNENGEFLGSSNIIIMNFIANQIRPYESIIISGSSEEQNISEFKIQYNMSQKYSWWR